MASDHSKDTTTSWASPNEHLMFFDFSSWLVVDMGQRWERWVSFKQSFLRTTRSPFWSPQYFFLTFFQLRTSNVKLCENWNWAPKGDDFNLLHNSAAEPFGRDLKIHMEKEAQQGSHAAGHGHH
eukprot:TRINITY_DN6760_c0_g1_i1.p2 TRINITY_DN6760_c0_g1~~TRINITY_DN6760_c0_g1_i1.p2  ORF type:complete len:136 (-),score=26.77 TRINITY_DN6760_c0_g1_i1:128-499(-)